MPELGDIINIKTKKVYKQGELDFSKIKNIRNYRQYVFNPAKGVARYYSLRETFENVYIKDKYIVERDYSYKESNKARALRDNIISTIELKISDDYNDYTIMSDVRNKLNLMDDKQLTKFADDNYNLIQHFFKYEDSAIGSSDMDARLFLLLSALGLDPNDNKYKMNKGNVEQSVKLLKNMENQLYKVDLENVRFE